MPKIPTQNDYLALIFCARDFLALRASSEILSSTIKMCLNLALR